MKKIFLQFLILFCFNKVFAQYNVIKVDLAGLLFSERIKQVRVSAERSFHKHFSGLFSYEIGTYNSGGTSINGGPERLIKKTTGWGIMPELRFYPSAKFKPAPIGLFLGVHFRYRQVLEKYSGVNYLNNNVNADVSTKGTAYNFGFHIGSKLSAGYLIFEPLVGFGVANGTWQTPNERDKIDPFFATDLSNFWNSFRLEFSVGFVFPKVKRTNIDPVIFPAEITYDTSKQEIATVIIYRPKWASGSLISYDVYANDSLVTNMSNGSLYIFETAKLGLTTFSARTEEKNDIVIKLEKGKIYYLECAVSSGILVGHPSFELVQPAIGKEETEKIINKLLKKSNKRSN